MFKKLISVVLINTVMATSIAYAGMDAIQRKQQAAEIECLALNIYFETHAVSLADGIAVSDVVMNRVKDSRFPNTVCEVVKQGHQDSQGNMKRHKCQFSWYCDGKSDEPKDSVTWLEAIRIADLILQENVIDITDGALYYHADYIYPYWADHLERLVQIEAHIFYK